LKELRKFRERNVGRLVDFTAHVEVVRHGRLSLLG
jgi:hypothetical protein